MLRHQPRQVAGKLKSVADDLLRPQPDGPGVHRARQRNAVAVDDVAALRDQLGQTSLGPCMIAERRKIEDTQHDNRNDAAIDQQAEHQPLVHHRQNLPSLPDKSEPLGPRRDESGCRCVHRAVPKSLVFFDLAAAGSGASGSTLAVRIGFVTGFTSAARVLSPAFLSVFGG